MSFLAFVLRRVLWTIPVHLVVILFTFLLVRAIATGPYSPHNQPRADRIRFHLDEPWYEQYAFYAKSVFTSTAGPRACIRAGRSTTSSSSNTLIRSCSGCSPSAGRSGSASRQA